MSESFVCHGHVARRPGATTKQSLSAEQRSLLLFLQRLRYGRILVLPVRGGQPVLTGLRGTRTVKVLGTNAPHPASSAPDYVLRREVTEFLRFLAALGNGEVSNLEVRDGLPFTFEVEETLVP